MLLALFVAVMLLSIFVVPLGLPGTFIMVVAAIAADYFAAAGIGARLYQGTGVERAFQPLSQFVLLTKTSDAKVLFTVGGGVKWFRSNGMSVRFEVRDYFTPAPTGVLFPPPGAKVGGWLHDIVPQVGIAYTF